MTAKEAGPVLLESRDGVAVITIDNPPVNAGSVAVRSGLLAAVAAVGEKAEFKAAVLIGAGKTFVSGSDIREFEGPIAEPQMTAVVAAIEACPKPIVAAISGNALGGGYEIALACDGRIANPDAHVGLPEVTLGIIPGAGGTQRLPRLVGRARAMSIIANARRVPAPEARDIGMIDRIADGDLVAAAVEFARSMNGRKNPVSVRSVPGDESGALDAASAAARNLGRRNAAIVEAVTAVEMAGTVPFADAIVRERAIFQRLRQGEAAAALRYLFFAERGLMRAARSDAPDIRTAGVVGLGLMGSGIAAALAAGRIEVRVTDRDSDAVTAGLARIRDAIGDLARRGKITADEARAAAGRVTPVPGLAGLAGLDLVVEAVFEDLDVKRAVFAELDQVLATGAIIASNTSYLDIDAVASAAGHAERVAGLHFFSPAHLMRPVEVIKGAASGASVVARLRKLVARIDKLPIAAGNGEGFIGNRILSAYRAQCEFLLEEGALPHDVDAALVAFGMAMGPFAVSDMAGLDIAWAMRKRKAATRDPGARYVAIADRLCEAGRFGRKSGAGWYRYAEGAKRGEADEAVRHIIEEESQRKGITRRTISGDEMVDRAMAAIVNEAAKVLGEGIAERASDIDLLLVNGYGFPQERGGPLFWASRRPREEIHDKIGGMVTASGFGAVVAGNLDAVLDAVAAG